MIEEYIKPEQLSTRLVEWKDPQPTGDEILVDVHYAGLNCTLRDDPPEFK